MTKNQPLINYEIAPVPDHCVHRKVVDFVDNAGNWLWESFSFLLPHNILLRIASYKPPLADDGADQVFWAESAKGCFIVKSAYHALSKTILSDDEKLWSLAWSWKGPQSIRFFIWLVLHDKLKTRFELSRRHLLVDDWCDRCGSTLENTIHVI